MIEEVLVPIALFITIFGILYVYLSTRNKERLALIEKGADASMFTMKTNKLFVLKAGMFLSGLAIGLLFGNLLAETTRIKEEIAYISMALLCGGTSLILYYLVEKKIVKGKE
jgi:hypothetical protein